jgi:N-acetylmuramoyl-L-alanine amidase
MDRGTPHKPILVVDPGHGGIKPGAVDPLYGIKEKDITLKVALYLKEWAQKEGGE